MSKGEDQASFVSSVGTIQECGHEPTHGRDEENDLVQSGGGQVLLRHFSVRGCQCG